jgi:hypothetical protein
MFEPKRPDGRSYRDVAIDLLKDMERGEIVTYQALGRALDLHPVRDRAKIQNAVRQANKPLLKLHQRGVQAVENEGYRMLPAREHVMVANGHQSKADKAMVRAIDFFNGTDLTQLTDAERKLHQGQAMLAQALYASHKSLDRRIRRIEDILDPKTIDGSAER